MAGDYVLVVDDNGDVRRLVTDLLDSMGLPARQAKDGAEALEQVRQEMPRAIVLDLMMPVMDGFTVLTHLKATAGGADIPVILLSAIAEDSPAIRGLPNVKGILRKGNFAVSDLRALITSVLDEADAEAK
jgi:CheY-like chemotaxis protein